MCLNTATLLASLIAAACGGGGGDDPADTTTPPPSDFVTDAPVPAAPAAPGDVVADAGDPIDVAAGSGDLPGASSPEDTHSAALAGSPSSCEIVPGDASVSSTQRRVTDFGAVRDDGRDDTAAIQRALDAMKSGETLVFPTGRYQISSSVRVRVPGVTIRGESGAIIHATNPDSMALLIEQDGTTVRGLTFTAITSGRRNAAWHARIAVAGGNPDGSWRRVYDTVIRDNKILPSGDPGTPGANSASTAGILMLRADRFLIANNTIARTLADGIHITNGSRNGRVLNNTVRETGDDMIAVVSYADSGNAALNRASNLLASWTRRLDERLNENILIAGNKIGGQYWGRGISVVGGEKVTIARNLIDNTPVGAAILLAREANYQTFGVTNVLVEGNTIRNVQNMAPSYNALSAFSTSRRTGHGAVELHASQFEDESADPMLRSQLTVRNVRIRGNLIERSSVSAVRMGAGGRSTLTATQSSGAPVSRSYAPAPISPPSIETGRFNAIGLEPLSAQSADLQASGVHCSGNLRDGATYQPALCRSAAPTVTGATITCTSDGRLQ
jgi:parallel beta-helix repeat protein